jgi:hypothetical protein
MIRLAIRGYGEGTLLFEDCVEVADAALDTLVEQLATKHVKILNRHTRHMIEIEFLDVPDPHERFFRFGTDPTAMGMPLAVKLSPPAEEN